MQTENMNNKEIVSVAVEIGNGTVLYKLNQSESLPVIIEKLCEENNIHFKPEQYSLHLIDSKNSEVSKYVTEENRSQITNGSILKLVYSPQQACNRIHQKIQLSFNEHGDDVSMALQKLLGLSRDRTFSEEFVRKHGILTIVSLVKEPHVPFQLKVYCLSTILNFFSHELITDIDAIPIDFAVNFVITNNPLPSALVEISLSLLKRLLKCKKTPESVLTYIKSAVTLRSLASHIYNKEQQKLQECGLKFLNVLVTLPGMADVIQVMNSEAMRTDLCRNILNRTVSHGMACQLYIYQCTILGLLLPRLNKLVHTDGEAAASLQELSTISYCHQQHIKRDSIVSLIDETGMNKISIQGSIRASSLQELEMPTPLLDKKTRRLLCQRSKSTAETVDSGDDTSAVCEINKPYQSSTNSVEISQLTLDCMLYFAKKYVKSYTRIQLTEEKALKEPFYCICDRLVRLLCDVLHVGHKPAKNTAVYQPLLFHASNESPFFKELFCRSTIRLSNTRREMKARTPQDHEKVLRVLSHQMKEALNMQPNTWKELELNLQEWSYEKVSQAWQMKHEKDLVELKHLPSVSELRENLENEMKRLIQRQRLNLLCKGEMFFILNSRGQKSQKKFRFIYLSSNHKVFHYGDCTEKKEEDPVECSSKVSVSSITYFVTGKKCPHFKEAKPNRKPEPELAFSLLLDVDQNMSSLDFIAPSQEVFDCWTDGLSILLGQKMKSKTMERDLDNLVDMELSLHLLDVEGITLPHDPPEIPNEPPNYDFQCKK